jgi:hypothetical protein
MRVMRSVQRSLWRPVAAAAVVFALSACGDATGTGGTDSTVLNGIFVGDAVSGSLSITISSASLSIVAAPNASVADAMASVSVTGSLKITGGASVSLTGTYDTGTHTITVSGGGYAFTGTFANGVLTGTFTTPDGGTGSFTTASTGGSATVTSYCGTYAGTSNSDAGVFNLVVNSSAGTATGFARPTTAGQHPVQLTGTVSGNTVNLTTQQIGGDEPHNGTATATISGSSISGSYKDNQSGNGGTFSGSVCQ